MLMCKFLFLVLGVDKSGHLWFQLDSDQGVSFWDDVKDFNSMICKGIVPIESKPSQPQNSNTSHSINNNSSYVPFPKLSSSPVPVPPSPAYTNEDKLLDQAVLVI